MRNLIISCVQCILTLAFLCTGAAYASEVKVPLYKLQTEDKPMRMGNQSGATNLTIPLAKRMNMKQVRLHLSYTNSIGLLRNRSSMAIAVNGHTVRQLVLDPAMPEAEADIDLPASLFKAGYNKLGFSVVQHYTDGSCEDQLAPELWSEINAVKSNITFDGELYSVKPVLSDLEHYFDPKLSNYWKVNILSAQAGTADAKHLGWANLAAQGVAARLRYVPLAVHYASAQTAANQTGDFPGLNLTGLSDTDNVLVGTAQELSAYLSSDIKAAITGSFLGVYPVTSNSGRIIVVISGKNDDEVAQAAMAFAHAMYAMPDAQSTIVKKFTAPEWKSYDASGVLQYDNKYTLKRLGLDTQTVKGYYAPAMNLNFAVPADMYVNEHKGIKLDLHLTYGAGFRSDSVVNIMLNNLFLTAIHLDAPSGADLRHYEVMLPARSIMPGKNVIEIQPQLTPSVTGNCTLLQDRNLQLTINGDSTLKMPDGEHYARMPDMSLMNKSGFPYSITPNGADTQVWLPNVSQDSASAAMTLLGRMTQLTGVPLSAVSFSTSAQPDAGKNLIVVADAKSLPASLNSKAPFQFENGTITTTDPAHLVQPSPSAVVGMGEIGTNLSIAEPAGNRPASTLQNSSSLGDTALLMQFESPYTTGKTATVLTATTGPLLAYRTDALVTPEFWSKISGNTFRWQETDQSIFADSTGSIYHIGSIGPVSRMDYYFSHYPWLWITLAALLLLVFVWVARKLIKRYYGKHYAEISTK
jgi:hypothetical protein